MLDKLPYPWTDNRGLSQAIDDPSLWEEACKKLRNTPREQIKRAAKRVFHDIRVLRHDDPEALGNALTRLLSSPQGRGELKRQGVGTDVLSSHLLKALRVRYREALDHLDESAPEEADKRHAFDLARVRTWLLSNPLSTQSRPWVACLLCAFALQNREDASHLANDLVAQDSELRALLAQRVLVSDEQKPYAFEKPRSQKPPTDKARETIQPYANGSCDVKKATKESRVPSLCEWRQDISRRLAQLDADKRLLGELEELAAAVSKEAAVAANLPWLSKPLMLDHLLCLRETASLGEESVRLQTAQTELARLLRAHTQAEILTERLGRRPAPLVRGGATDLANISEEIEKLSFELAAEAEAIGQVLETARIFLDQLAAGDVATAVQMCEQVARETWSTLARTLFDPSLITPEMGVLRKNLATENVASLLLAQLMRFDRSAGIDLVRWLFPVDSDVTRAARSEVVFGFLNCDELQQAASGTPAATEAATLLLFAAALRQSRPELLECLAPFVQTGELDAITRGFYRTLLDSWRRRRITALTADLRQACEVSGGIQAAETASERQRDRLLQWLNSPPGMRGNFHFLRVCAQQQFLLPLRDAIEEPNATEALRLWDGFGSLDEMVNRCIAQLRPTDRPQPRHHTQTRAYLVGFADDLKTWVRLSTGAATEALAELIEPIRVLRAAAPRNTAATSLLQAIEAGENISFPALDFTERVDNEGCLHLNSVETASWLSPTMLATWPRALEGKANIAHLLADTLRQGLSTGKITLDQAIETYLAGGQLEAARLAAIGHPELEAKVDAIFTQRRRALTVAHADLLQEAEQIAEVEPNIAESLGLVRSTLARNDFAEVFTAITLLRECVAEFRRRHDPERQPFVEWLREARVEPALETSVSDLQRQCSQVRAASSRRRSHIESLTAAASDPRAAEPVRVRWTDVVKQIDRPRLWPSADDAELLAIAITEIAQKLRGKWHTRIDESDPSTTVVRRIAEWMQRQLLQNLPALATDSFERVSKLQQLLDEGSGDAALLCFVGSSSEASGIAEPTRTSQPPRVIGFSVSESVACAVTERPRPALLLDMLKCEPQAPSADVSRLRHAARAGRWADAKALAGALLATTPDDDSELRKDLLAVFGAAKFAEGTGIPEWLPEAVAAILESRRSEYFLGEQVVAEFVPRALLRVLSSPHEGSYCQQLAGSLQRTVNLAGSDSSFLQLADFIRATDAAPRLAEVVWGTFTGLPRVEQPRSALLRLLFRMRESDALRYLVDKTTVDKVRPVIRACLDAFIAAETQPDARPVALQLSAALRTQATGVANTLPWVLLFHSVQGVRDESEPGSVTISLDSDFPWQDADGALGLDVRVKPSLFDPPARLSIRAGSAAPFPLCEEPLFTERVVHVPLPTDLEFGLDGESRLAFTVEGVTVLGATISQASAWAIVRAESTVPIEPWRIETLWPGARRDPVLRNQGFFGRERELHEIESRLTSSPRSRSVMLFGERRIGKTSLIRNLIIALPPSAGRICGVFCDVSGLHASPGDLAVRFFDRIATSLTVESDNCPVVESLRVAQHHTVTLKELVRGLDPRASIYAALEGLSRRLEELSGGLISRLALFIDEFDSFVVPMLGARREEVNQLMWELRQIIQRSDRVAVILAGSGLQRIYKENYQDALYGSIDEVALFRFDWDRDREAILDTFLPQTVRAQLCRHADIERVARRAAEICDGHPMFLALLGSATAKFAKGRLLTPGLLDRTVAAMMRDQGLVGGETIERQVFYGFIFKQLDIVPAKDAALGKHLLAVLAQHTLPEDRSSTLRINQLFEISGLLGMATTSELLQVLDRLAKIDAVKIDRVTGRVRIGVPLTAAALREDAPRLREEAREELRISNPAK